MLAPCTGSPDASRSHYVNEEIKRFKTLGRADFIIPLIIGGEPGDAEKECFPAALRFKLGSDGALTQEPEEPIAADARPEGDGKNTCTPSNAIAEADIKQGAIVIEN